MSGTLKGVTTSQPQVTPGGVNTTNNNNNQNSILIRQLMHKPGGSDGLVATSLESLTSGGIGSNSGTVYVQMVPSGTTQGGQTVAMIGGKPTILTTTSQHQLRLLQAQAQQRGTFQRANLLKLTPVVTSSSSGSNDLSATQTVQANSRLAQILASQTNHLLNSAPTPSNSTGPILLSSQKPRSLPTTPKPSAVQQLLQASPSVPTQVSSPALNPVLVQALQQPITIPALLPTPSPPPPPVPEVTKEQEIKALDMVIKMALNLPITQKNLHTTTPPVWWLIFEKYGHDRCAPLTAFAHFPLANEWPDYINANVAFEIKLLPSDHAPINGSNGLAHNYFNLNQTSVNGTGSFSGNGACVINNQLNSPVTTPTTPGTSTKNVSGGGGKKKANMDHLVNSFFWFVKIVGNSGECFYLFCF